MLEAVIIERPTHVSTEITPSLKRPPGRPGLSFEAYEKAYFELAGEDGTPPSQREIRKYLVLSMLNCW